MYPCYFIAVKNIGHRPSCRLSFPMADDCRVQGMTSQVFRSSAHECRTVFIGLFRPLFGELATEGHVQGRSAGLVIDDPLLSGGLISRLQE